MSSPVGSWVDVPCENREAAPSSRTDSACAVYEDCLYVFGGRGFTQLNDLYEFNFSRKLWRVVPATGVVPSGRQGHTCVVYKDALYVFGGHDGRSYLNDLMEFNFPTQQWSTVVANAGSAPTPRYRHSVIVYGNSMFVFGGHSGSNLNDFHEFNFATRTWALVRSTGTAPPPRHSASLVVFESSAILFGGCGGSGYLSDLHMFDFGQRMWSTVVVEGPLPTPRYGHVAVVHANAMYVFGGQSNTTTNDLHKLSLGPTERPTWQTVASEGTLPRACYYHTGAVYDSSLFVFGGQGNDNNFSQFRFEKTKYIPESVAIPGSSFLSYLRSLVNNELTSDITFVVEDAPIYGHRNLCMRCDYFKAMFTTEMLESRTREVVISDVSRPIFLSFLEYLYADEVDEAVEDTMELLVVADRYGEDRLKSICESRILVSLCVGNAATLFHAADQYKAAVLRDQCVSFMLKNFDVVSKTPAFGEMGRKNFELVVELLNLR